jgi:hypothetical protein
LINLFSGCGFGRFPDLLGLFYFLILSLDRNLGASDLLSLGLDKLPPGLRFDQQLAFGQRFQQQRQLIDRDIRIPCRDWRLRRGWIGGLLFGEAVAKGA